MWEGEPWLHMLISMAHNNDESMPPLSYIWCCWRDSPNRFLDVSHILHLVLLLSSLWRLDWDKVAHFLLLCDVFVGLLILTYSFLFFFMSTLFSCDFKSMTLLVAHDSVLEWMPLKATGRNMLYLSIAVYVTELVLQCYWVLDLSHSLCMWDVFSWSADLLVLWFLGLFCNFCAHTYTCVYVYIYTHTHSLTHYFKNNITGVC